MDGYHDRDLGAEWPAPFRATETGIWYRREPRKPTEETPPSTWVCDLFQVVAETMDKDGGAWGILLRWRDRAGNEHEWAMPRGMLHMPGNEIAAELDNAGLRCAPTRETHELLKLLLSRITSPQRKRCVPQAGWHQTESGHSYVLPSGEVYGPDAGKIILQGSRTGAADATKVYGTLRDWQDRVARFAVGNHRLGLFMSAAFSGPLLEMTAAPTGGIHLHGRAQSGKTTALLLAASVWGQATTRGVVKTWRATANGLEGVAAKAMDGLLLLDEISQANSDEVGDIIYQLGNEAGKARAARDGSSRPVTTWRLAYLSTGEKTVGTKMGERNNQVNAGQDVRLINIPSDAGAGMGVFQNLHDFATPLALLTHLTSATTTETYGTAAPAFIDRLARQRAADPQGLQDHITTLRQIFLGKMLPQGADGQVVSVCRRFSLIAAAGELATEWGVLPWPKHEAINAVAAAFKAWLTARGGIGAVEDRQAILQVRRYLERHGEGQFRLLVPNDAQTGGEERLEGRDVTYRAGFRRSTSSGTEFLIFPEIWREDVCKGIDSTRAATALHRAGFLEKGDGRNWAKRHRVPETGDLPRFFTIRSSIFGE